MVTVIDQTSLIRIHNLHQKVPFLFCICTDIQRSCTFEIFRFASIALSRALPNKVYRSSSSINASWLPICNTTHGNLITLTGQFFSRLKRYPDIHFRFGPPHHKATLLLSISCNFALRLSSSLIVDKNHELMFHVMIMLFYNCDTLLVDIS